MGSPEQALRFQLRQIPPRRSDRDLEALGQRGDGEELLLAQQIENARLTVLSGLCIG